MYYLQIEKENVNTFKNQKKINIYYGHHILFTQYSLLYHCCYITIALNNLASLVNTLGYNS